MGKQEKAAKKAAKAAAAAEAIIAAAVVEVKAKAVKAKVSSDEESSLAQQVKELRDGGMAWWQIGFTLGLPGCGDTVHTGKSGASKARALYKKEFGSLPATARSRAAQNTDRRDRVYGDGPKPAGRRRKDTIVRIADAESMFLEHTDEEVAEMLRGKRITYINSISNAEDTVRVHDKSPVRIVEQVNGKAVQFRESHQDDHSCDPKFRYLPAHMRTIILERIVKVSA